MYRRIGAECAFCPYVTCGQNFFWGEIFLNRGNGWCRETCFCRRTTCIYSARCHSALRAKAVTFLLRKFATKNSTKNKLRGFTTITIYARLYEIRQSASALWLKSRSILFQIVTNYCPSFYFLLFFVSVALSSYLEIKFYEQFKKLVISQKGTKFCGVVLVVANLWQFC